LSARYASSVASNSEGSTWCKISRWTSIWFSAGTTTGRHEPLALGLGCGWVLDVDSCFSGIGGEGSLSCPTAEEIEAVTGGRAGRCGVGTMVNRGSGDLESVVVEVEVTDGRMAEGLGAASVVLDLVGAPEAAERLNAVWRGLR